MSLSFGTRRNEAHHRGKTVDKILEHRGWKALKLDFKVDWDAQTNVCAVEKHVTALREKKQASFVDYGLKRRADSEILVNIGRLMDSEELDRLDFALFGFIPDAIRKKRLHRVCFDTEKAGVEALMDSKKLVDVEGRCKSPRPSVDDEKSHYGVDSAHHDGLPRLANLRTPRCFGGSRVRKGVEFEIGGNVYHQFPLKRKYSSRFRSRYSFITSGVREIPAGMVVGDVECFSERGVSRMSDSKLRFPSGSKVK